MTHPDIYRCEQTGYPYPEKSASSSCDICSGELYTGDDYYDFCGEIVCRDCISDYIEHNYLQTINW